MIQDIAPHVMHNEMQFVKPCDEDLVLSYQGKSILVAESPLTDVQTLHLPTVALFRQTTQVATEPSSEGNNALIYLFAIDDQRFFLESRFAAPNKATNEKTSVPAHTEAEPLTDNRYALSLEGYRYFTLNKIREARPLYLSFAIMTGYQLYCWYRDNQFCGRCGAPTHLDKRERAIDCPVCGNRVYPRVMPAIIVAVTDEDRILLTHKAQGGYHFYALVSGFCEIGETAEQTVQREVMEEAGLRVKNIRYYKTQPWGISSDLLIGYFCELDGSPEISLNDGELAKAVWVRRDDMDDILDDHYSLTREMMECFKEGRLPFL